MVMKCFLVGGAVRDMVLGISPKDCDYVLTGMTKDAIDILEENGFTLVGEDFPVYLHPETGCEFALARYERKSGSGYRGFVVDTSADISITDDLARRDLTMNSMAVEVDFDFDDPLASSLEPRTGDIIDPFGGVFDIEQKMLRHTTLAFTEDPVRVLRIARFAARYGFEIHESTKQLMVKMQEAGELKHLQPDRIQLELTKASNEKVFSRFIDSLFTEDIFGDIFGVHLSDRAVRFSANKYSDRLNFIKKPEHRLAVAFVTFEQDELIKLKFKNSVIKLHRAANTDILFRTTAAKTHYDAVVLFDVLKKFGLNNKSNREFADDFLVFMSDVSETLNSFLLWRVVNDLLNLEIGVAIESAGVSGKQIKPFVDELCVDTIKKSLLINQSN